MVLNAGMQNCFWKKKIVTLRWKGSEDNNDDFSPQTSIAEGEGGVLG